MTKRLHFTLLGLQSFLILFSYAIARPATESLFLEAYTKAGLPGLWLVVAGAMTVVVIGVNGRLNRNPPARLLSEVALISALLLVAVLVSPLTGPWIYALAIWKEIYIVLLMEALYTHANARLPIHEARWLYGLMGVVGSGAALLGGELVGQLSLSFGTTHALWALPVLLGLVALIARGLPSGGDDPEPREGRGALGAALRGVWRSEYLLLLMILIAVVQVAINLVDFMFKGAAEIYWADPDLRTQAIGRVYSAISIVTLLLNTTNGLIYRAMGIPKVMLTVPLLLLGGLAALALAPGVAVLVAVKVASKAFDYTLFRTGKEMLYIPLEPRARLDGKPVEMWTYRVSKGLASLLLLAIIGLSDAVLLGLLVGVTLLWLGLMVVLARRFRARVSLEEERASR